jgi:ribose transport system permease protein
MIVIAAVGWYVLEHTPYGRYLYAIGGSKEAARLAGVNVRRLTFSCFMVSALLGAIAGLLTASRMGSGDPTTGPSFLLPVLAGALLGAAAYKPGTYNIAGTIIAVFTLAVGVTGLQLLGAPFWIEPVFNGAALIIAVGVTRYLQKEAL